MFYIVIMLEDERGFKTNDVCYSGRQPFITPIHLNAVNLKTQLEEDFPTAKYKVAEVKLLSE